MISITENIIDYAQKASERLKFQFPYNLKTWVNDMDMMMENYHKHTTWSDLVQVDSPTSIDDFIKLSDSYGCTCYFSGEHGFLESGCIAMMYAKILIMRIIGRN